MALANSEILVGIDEISLMEQQYCSDLSEPSPPQKNIFSSTADAVIDENYFTHNCTASAPLVDCIAQRQPGILNDLSPSQASSAEYFSQFFDECVTPQLPATNDNQYPFLENDQSISKLKVDLDLYPSHQHHGISLQEVSNSYENSTLQCLFTEPIFGLGTGLSFEEDKHLQYDAYDISDDPIRNFHAFPLPHQSHQLQEHFCNVSVISEQHFGHSFGDDVADRNFTLESSLSPSLQHKTADPGPGGYSFDHQLPTMNCPSSIHSDLSRNLDFISTSSSFEAVTKDIYSPLEDPFQTSWWMGIDPNLPTANAIANSRSDFGISLQSESDSSPENSLMSSEPWITAPSPPALSHGLESTISSTPRTPLRPPPSNPPQSPCKSRHVDRPSLITPKIIFRSICAEGDYSRMSTKKSRGRRPLILPELRSPTAVGQLSVGFQAVLGGKAFDPSLNPHADSVRHCGVTKTGKRKKIFICEVEGCGKCFKRTEHLRRHVRSIHTNYKPYDCPWPTCARSFSRHDNLNQHMRVHRAEPLGQVLDGLHIGSDGILRASGDESIVDPVSRGLKNVELSSRLRINDAKSSP